MNATRRAHSVRIRFDPPPSAIIRRAIAMERGCASAVGEFLYAPPAARAAETRYRWAAKRDVSQPIKPTAPEQSVLFTWPACEDGGFGKRLRVAWLLAHCH